MKQQFLSGWIAFLLLVLAPRLTLQAATFSNTASLSIADRATVSGPYGVASTYPSNVTVSGMSGTVSSVTVTITGYNAPRPGDIDILLVAPGGQTFVVMSDSGDNFTGGGAATNATLTFSDAAASSLPDSGAITSGTFRPRNVTSTTEVLPAPAPAAPYNNPAPIGSATFASVFNGLAPNGVWSLYVVDDALGGGASSITGGWTLNITSAVLSPTTTTLSTSNAASFTAAPNNSVTLTATVTSSSAVNAGTVTFTDLLTGTVLGSAVPVNASGIATLVTSFATEGVRTLQAVYSGSAAFGTSNGSVTQEVNNHTVVSGNNFSNSLSGLVVNDSPAVGQFGSARPYPSKIFVSGLSGTITQVTVSLTNVNQPRPDDMDLLLVGPAGQSIVLMSDNGGLNALTNTTLTFSDAAASTLPDDTTIVAGTYRPSNAGAGADTFPAPAPAASAATTLATFNGTNPNGTWTLFVVDDALGGGGGTIAGGWTLTLTTITAAATTTQLTTSNPQSFTAPPNQSVTFTATVTSTSTVNAGTVTFTDTTNSVVLGANVPVNASGVATVTTSFTTEGTRSIQAVYSGTLAFATSSASVSQEVNNRTVVSGTTFSNTLSGISVSDAPAAGQFGLARPYPSKIFVSGLAPVAKITVTLTGLNAARPDDLDVLLVSPAGTALTLMSDAGTTTSAVTNLTVTFDDSAASFLPDEAALASGTFRPSNFGAGGDTFPAPAPTPGAGTTLSAFNGQVSNGEWRLFVVDDSLGGGASAWSGGWSLTITPVNSAPTLLDTAVTLASVLEDTGAPTGAVGTLVSAIVDLNPPSGGRDNVTDPDLGTSIGIAVIGADTGQGTWHYSLNNGSVWLPLGVVSNTSARVLAADSSTRLYFQPNPNFTGTIPAALSFRAWDQTNSIANGTGAVNASVNGGSTAFSAATDTASVTVTNVNDPPTITGQTAISTAFNTPRSIALTDLLVTDIDNTFPTGFTLTVGSGTNYTRVGNTVTPAANFFGTLTVPVQVSDGLANSNTFNLSVTVNPDPIDAQTKTTISKQSNGTYRVTFIGNPGRTYTIEYTPSLLPANWQTLTTTICDPQGSYFIVDNPPVGTTQRFYRAILP